MGCGQSSSSILEPKGRKIIMFGGVGSGKTSVLYQLTKKMSVPAIPTVGHNAEYLQLGKERFVLYDIGARNADFNQINHLLESAVALVFMIDAASPNTQMLKDSSELFTQVIKHKQLIGLPIAICLNKQDLQDKIYIDEEVVQTNYPLNQLSTENMKIFKISQKTLLDIEEPFKWLASLNLKPVAGRKQQANEEANASKKQPASPKKKNQNMSNQGIPASTEQPHSNVSKPETQEN